MGTHDSGRLPTGARLVLRRLAQAWLVCCVLLGLLFLGTGLVGVIDPTTPDRADQIIGAFVLLGIIALTAWPAVRVVRPRAGLPPLGSRPLPTGRRTRGRAPAGRIGSRHYANRYRANPVLFRPIDGVTSAELARLGVAERRLGDVLYRLDLRKAELGVPRSMLVAARTSGLDTAATLRDWARLRPRELTAYELAQRVHAGVAAIEALAESAEALLAEGGSTDRLVTTTRRVAAIAHSGL